MTDWRWHNFTADEMRCRCGCGRADMSPLFMDVLQTIRMQYGKPMRVSSGYRCPSHNAKVSSTGPGGPHTTGKAVDILVSGKDAHTLLQLCMAHMDVTGIGVSQKGAHDSRFIHIDTIEEGLRPWLWSY